ncbi:MAG: hypothetical protein H7Z42_22390 [Roseiflexaceae bacterium]|nr:hypothetical protein [Roseiflexaceae bacterium]
MQADTVLVNGRSWAGFGLRGGLAVTASAAHHRAAHGIYCPSASLPPVALALDDWTCDSPLETDAKKKSLRANERDCFERVLFGAVQAGFDADDVVVLDEFGSNINLTRRYGRAPLGERVHEGKLWTIGQREIQISPVPQRSLRFGVPQGQLYNH